MPALHSHIEGAFQAWKERLSCSAEGCRGRRPWARMDAASIRFHGHRYCFPRCFEQELQRRLLELAQAPAQQLRPRHRLPLGLLMISRGELDQEQLQHALEAQRQDQSRRIGEHLRQMGFAQEPQITNALAAQWSCPVVRALPAPVAHSPVPFALLRRFRMVPVYFSPSTRVLHIAFAGDIEYRILLAIEQMLECKAEACVADANAVQSWLESGQNIPRGSDQLFERVRSLDEIARITVSYAARFCASDARMARCGEYIWIRLQHEHATNLLFRQSTEFQPGILNLE